MFELLRELADDQQWRNDVSVRLGLSGIAALLAIAFADSFVAVPVWAMGLPVGFFVLAATVAPDLDWQHAQDGGEA